MKFSERYMTDYALRVLRGNSTLEDAVSVFKEDYNRFLILYKSMRDLEIAVKESKKLNNVAAKQTLYGIIQVKVKEVNWLLDLLRKDFNKVDIDAENRSYGWLTAPDYHKDWNIVMEAFRIKDPLQKGEAYEVKLGDVATYQLDYDMFIKYNNKVLITYWQENQFETTIHERTIDMDANNAIVEYNIRQLLNDIGYTDMMRSRLSDEQIRKNKGLQLFLLFTEW